MSEHRIRAEWDSYYKKVVVRGVSEWYIVPSGCCIRIDQRRETVLRTPQEVKRWAKRYGVDPSEALAEMEKNECGVNRY